jgi:HIRAN domain-containing protein
VQIDVEYDERYWYPEDGGQVWIVGFQVVDPGSGRYIGRDAARERGLHVVGVAGAGQHHAEALEAAEIEPGDSLELQRDPANEHDPNAIKVLAGDEQLGWVPRELAEELAPELDQGKPWSAIVLREHRRSPREPRDGLTMLLVATESIDLREPRAARSPGSATGRRSRGRPGPPR